MSLALTVEVARSEREFTGWLIWSRPPAEPLDQIIVTDETGKSVATRPLPYGTTGTRNWDVTLQQLGFRRTGDWMSTTGGFTCRCERHDRR